MKTAEQVPSAQAISFGFLHFVASKRQAVLLDRTILSQKNSWQDNTGKTFIVYPVTEIAKTQNKGVTTIKRTLKKLDVAGLLDRKQVGFSAANRLYVKLPPV